MTTLYSPLSIGKLEVKNRLVMPPMATRIAGEDDHITDEIIEYYRERARFSKVGLIITEHSYITMQGKAHMNQLSISKDSDIEGFRKLTDAVHSEGVKIIAQINHGGSASLSDITGMMPVSSSAFYHPRQQEELPKEMTKDEINETVDCFAKAALRVKEAGFDGVEIHSAHAYLLNQFYSPLANHRTDEYGPQSVENRTRFQVQVIKAVRDAVGEDFPVAIRLGGSDYTDGGSTIEDCVEACRLFEKAGADLIDLTGGMCGYIRIGHSEPGYFKDMSIPVKEAVNIPVILTGGVTEISQAESLILEDASDMIGVGRAIFKSAHWAD